MFLYRYGYYKYPNYDYGCFDVVEGCHEFVEGGWCKFEVETGMKGSVSYNCRKSCGFCGMKTPKAAQ